MAINVASRTVSRETLGAGYLVVATVLALCGCPSAKSEPGTQPADDPQLPRASVDQLHIETDLRRADAALTLALLRGAPSERAVAAMGLARIGSGEAADLLLRALSDPEPGVRQAASFGLGLVGEPSDQWTAAVAVESDPVTRRQMLSDLGAALRLSDAAPLIRELSGSESAAACAGLTQVVRRDAGLPAETRRTLLKLATGSDLDTAQACLNTLVADVIRRPPAVGPTGDGLAEALVATADEGLASTDGNLRLGWVRMMAALGSPAIPALGRALADREPMVAAAAYTSLVRAVGASDPQPLVSALLAALDRCTKPETSAASDPCPTLGLHALLDAVSAAASVATPHPNLVAALSRAVAMLAPDPDSPDVARAGLHCAAARAHDHARKFPSLTPGCGGGQVPAWVGDRAAAEVLALGGGQAGTRWQWLKRLLESPSPRMRAAAVFALTPVDAPNTLQVLHRGLQDPHLDVQTAAVASLNRIPAALATLRDQSDSTLAPALRAAFQTFHVKSHASGLLGWLSAVQLARIRSELTSVLVLAHHENAAVRNQAREVLREWDHPMATTSPDPVSDPLPRELLATRTSVVQLRAGTAAVDITLDPRLAPVSVARLSRWLIQLPGSTLEVTDYRPGHHVVLSAAADTTTPTWRSEESPAELTRGAVVIPQDVRDALRPALMILVAPEPELRGRVTVVGRVTEGLNQLDRWSLGTSARIASRASRL